MNEDKRLKDCPFCGFDAEVFRVGRHFGVRCKECSAKVYGFDSGEQAIDAWNMRSCTPVQKNEDYVRFFRGSKCDFCKNILRVCGMPSSCDSCVDFCNFVPCATLPRVWQFEEMPRPSIEDIWRWRVPLLWHDDESGDVSRAYISENLYFFVSTVYKCCRLNLKTGTYAGKFALLGAIPVVEDSEEDLETLKLRARFWLEDIVARVLGVERKKRL
ncbi:MAG: Lar family restriction alleviation protein [Opitutales bacterium]|nr:Lar family restriction alleviation protein [Opitutales bacterium]